MALDKPKVETDLYFMLCWTSESNFNFVFNLILLCFNNLNCHSSDQSLKPALVSPRIFLLWILNWSLLVLLRTRQAQRKQTLIDLNMAKMQRPEFWMAIFTALTFQHQSTFLWEPFAQAFPDTPDPWRRCSWTVGSPRAAPVVRGRECRRWESGVRGPDECESREVCPHGIRLCPRNPPARKIVKRRFRKKCSQGINGISANVIDHIFWRTYCIVYTSCSFCW